MRKIVLACFMLGGVCAAAQPMIQTKTVEIAKRPTIPVTKAGDVQTASVVTLRFVDAPLREVLAALAKQINAGVTIQATNDGYTDLPSLDWVETARVTVHLDRGSFWDAVAAVAKAAPVALDAQPDEGMLVLVEHPHWTAGQALSKQQGLLAMMVAPGARRVGAMLFSPMALETGYEDEKGKRLLVRVAAEPRVHGVSELAVLRLQELTSADGRSLLGDKSEFVTGPDRRGGDDWSRWVFRIRPVEEDVAVRAMRGELWIAAGKVAQGVLDVSKMFSPVSAVVGEVQTNDECQIFRAPTYGEARGIYTSKDREFPNECRVASSRHLVVGLDTPQIRGRHVDYTEERTLVMHNITAEPEVFVVWTVRPDSVRFTSEPRPRLVQDHGEFRVSVQPGETMRLHMGYEVNQEHEHGLWKRTVRQLNEVPVGPTKLWKQVTVGEMRLVVTSVVPQAGEYVLRGEVSGPVEGPVKYACPIGECIGIWPVDAAGKDIPTLVVDGPVTRVGGRDVMEWTATTNGRGMVPAKVRWNVDGVTEWVKVMVR